MHEKDGCLAIVVCRTFGLAIDLYHRAMGIFDILRQELIDIVEWLDDSNGHTLVWRFPRFRNEIKQGAQLIVRPGQTALFVHEGQVADIFEPGRHTLNTGNLPILGRLQGWKHGFESPIKSEVYFVSTKQITELKWGTQNPIMLRDPEFGPIRLRAFGMYALKAIDAKVIIEELVGTDGTFEAAEVTELIKSIIVTAFSELIGKSQVAALDLASNYGKFSDQLRSVVNEKIDDEYGLEVPIIKIVNISLPEEVEKALDTRSSMGVIGDLGRFQQYQMGQAMTQAASNTAPGGGAATGMGLGMGMAMANQMVQGMGQANTRGQNIAGGAPPPPPDGAVWHVSQNGAPSGPYNMTALQGLANAGTLTADSFVWSATLGAWKAAKDVPALGGLFAAPPPPPDA